MTGWAAAALVGPAAMTYLRQQSYNSALHDLTAATDPSSFLETFGAPTSDLQMLIDTKAITLQRLMEIVPAGTIDPTSGLYDTTLYSLAGVSAAAFLCNLMVTPIAAKHFVTDKVAKVATATDKSKASH